MKHTLNKQAYYEMFRDNEDELTIFRRDFSTCLAHFHSQTEILLVESGSAKVTVNECSMNLYRGGIAFSDSYDIHEYTDNDGQNRFCTLIIPRRYSTRFHKIIGDKQISNPLLENRKLCDECIEIAQCIKNEHDDEYLKQAYIDLIFGKLLKNFNITQRPKHRNVELMRDILSYINNNFSEPLTLESIAEHFGYSPSHFSRLFRSVFNCRVGDYIKRVRLKAVEERAQEQGAQKLTSLIYECGFNSPQTFYRTFSEYYNTSPKKYFADFADK